MNNACLRTINYYSTLYSSHLSSGRTETIRCRWPPARPEPVVSVFFLGSDGLNESSIVSDIVAHEHLSGDGLVETVQTVEVLAEPGHHGKSIGCRAEQLSLIHI